MPSPERTTLPEIVAAGAELLEGRGASGVTMQAVAERVGVRAPSLYKRVRDRDALLVLIAEAAAGELVTRLDASDGSIAGLAHAYRGFARDRPEGFRLIFVIEGASESIARASDPLLRAVGELVPEAEVLSAARLLAAWATGFLNMELAGAFRLGGDVDAAFDYGVERIAASLAQRAAPQR